MPLWIPIIIAVIALAATAATVLNWDEIVIRLKGKKIAMLGARGVGKTTLISFLTTGCISESYKSYNKSYKQTIRPENAKGRRFSLRDLDLKIKDTRDLPGGPDAYAEWKELFDEADLVFYLLRIDKLVESDAEAENRVRRDMKQIEMWLKDQSSLPRLFFIIGTHGDLANPDLTTLPENEQGNYQDRIRALPIIQECVQRAGGGHNTKVVLGSMKSPRETEALVFGIFSQVEGQS